MEGVANRNRWKVPLWMVWRRIPAGRLAAEGHRNLQSARRPSLVVTAVVEEMAASAAVDWVHNFEGLCKDRIVVAAALVAWNLVCKVVVHGTALVLVNMEVVVVLEAFLYLNQGTVAQRSFVLQLASPVGASLHAECNHLAVADLELGYNHLYREVLE